jgi:alkanesulfonate monooxygenase SsuD/methylene tetrahydromethanopterin reductase-like flavin-dependent oxidoreductase (luciferase family)
MITTFVICAETQAEAERLAAPIDLRRLQMARGQDAPIATVERALTVAYTHEDRMVIQRERARAIIGDPVLVKTRLLELQASFEADEIMLLTITGDYASRIRSYQLIAEAFALNAAETAIA